MSRAEELPSSAFPSRSIPARRLRALREAGAVERLGRGLYRRSDLPPADLDLIEIAARAQSATICLTTALARYDLIDAIPGRIDIAIPRGTRAPRTDAPVKWHRFDARTFALGRESIPVDDGETQIGIYSPERSIVDAFRLRGTEGYETATDALSNWLKRPGSHPSALLKIASELPRATGPLTLALGFLA
jgi:predicted transcriptional regulator of viral defense system